MSDIPGNQSAATDHLLVPTRGKVVLYVKGLAMGLADSVPGVSGGTIAVISNIYDELVFSIRSIDLQSLRLLLSGQPGAFWRHINGVFLLILFCGILSGLLISANTVLFLLANYYLLLMAFFMGLVLASCWLLKHEFSRKWENFCALCLGILFVAGINFINPRVADISYSYVFFSGIIAISAMILPGLSGAFILLLLGVYEFILGALVEFNFPYILVFVVGCAIGLLAFSRVLTWLLLKHHQLSYGFITGLLLGSILVLWPWQQTLSFYTDSSGQMHPLRTVSVSPFNYAQLSGEDPMLVAVLLSIAIGVAAVSLLSRLFNSKFMTGSE